ncbi:4682_t:CDS:2 [Diversispora eburnea]|uniref:4682_t:CDS:1 n=2 Tax=Diversisporales TaxID=214509 RepID=A0A9N8YUT4_9GLOM|nr:4682_t:CDS:2 [Diversispora eburnea]
MLRNNVLIDENVSPSPPQLSVLIDKEEEEEVLSQVTPVTITNVQTEISKILIRRKEILKNLYHVNTLHGTTGITVGTIGHQISNTNWRLRSCRIFFNILKQNKPVTELAF